MSEPLEDPTNKVLGDGEIIACGTTGDDRYCCFSQLHANRACKQAFGREYGYSNVWAIPATVKPNRVRPTPTCNKGSAYECRANTLPPCRKLYNKDGVFGTEKVGPVDSSKTKFFEKCAQYGTNAFPEMDSTEHLTGQCIISSWKDQQLLPFSLGPSLDDVVFPTTPQEPTELCCNPKAKDPLPSNTEQYLRSFCDPQTCFGKRACDDTKTVQQFCSDKDNVTKDPACIDTCIRSNDRSGGGWCNAKIKEVCQGKNLETDGCRQYCSANNLDKNRELADFCDNSYVQYCKSNDYATFNRERQAQLCGCINSPLPQANCVDNKCTNGIAIQTKSLRERKGKCEGNICISQIYIDVKTGNPIIDINKVKFEQYCPGVIPPWELQPKQNWRQNLELYIGIPVVLALVVVALVFLFKK